MEDNLGNVKIMGSGESSGGVFNEVKILGSGDINGDLECKELKILGAGDIHGNVKGETVKISGAVDVEGNINSDNMSVSGAADISGDVKCKNLKVAGAIDVSGDIYSEKIELAGAVDINGNCEAEVFQSSGVFDIEGMLNADEISIKLRGKSSVGEIGGEKIDVRKKDKAGFAKFFKTSLDNSLCKLECETIEGDEIYLEYTNAETVRGKNIVLGPKCNIENLEYSGNFRMSDESKVNVTKKI